MTTQYAYLTEIVECGCGDSRYRGEMCHICGKCQIGCCMCAEESANKDKRIAELEEESVALEEHAAHWKAAFDALALDAPDM